MKRFAWLIKWASNVTIGLGAIVTVLMMVHVFIDVLLDMIFNVQLPGTLVTVANYYMVAIAFLPLALVERRNQHISVDIVSTQFPDRIREPIRFAVVVVSFFLLCFLTWRGWIEAGRKFQANAAMLEGGYSIPVWPTFYLMPIGMGLFAAVLLYKILRYIRGGENRSVANEV